jgi:hypothetical protein
MTQLTPADDLFHEQGNDPFANESGWFGFMIPERNLIGGFHWHHRPNMNLTWQNGIIWDGKDGQGEEIYNCRYYDGFEIQAFEESHTTSNFDFSTSQGLTVKTIEPWKRYAVKYERNECVVDVEFEAIMGCRPHAIQHPRQGVGGA